VNRMFEQSNDVRIKVVDTATFIHVARLVWGDKYDYSQTIYKGSQKPITIVCRECGPFELSQAGSHYRSYAGNKRSCGCRHCERLVAIRREGKDTKCVTCGAWAKYRSAHKYPMCSACKGNLEIQKSWQMACIGLQQLRQKARTARRKSKNDPWEKRIYACRVALGNRINAESQKKSTPPVQTRSARAAQKLAERVRQITRTYTRNGKTYAYVAKVKPDTLKRSRVIQYDSGWSGTISKEKHKLGKKGRTKWQRKIQSARASLRRRPYQPTTNCET
jgi:hypothetical protein